MVHFTKKCFLEFQKYYILLLQPSFVDSGDYYLSHRIFRKGIVHRCVYRGGGPKGPGPPPLEIDKQKKKKKGHQSKFKAILPIFCYFFSRKYHLLSYFLSYISEKLKSKKKKKKGFHILPPPPPYEFLDTRLVQFKPFGSCSFI